MWEKLRQLARGLGAEDTPAPSRFEQQQIAAAALMVEAARLDGTFDQDERAHLAGVLRKHFELSEEDVDALIGEAEHSVAESVEWQGFTRTVKDGFDHEGRVAVIEMLWQVAYADGELHDYEASLLRRVAGLIYVSDRESGEARQRVLARLGLDRA
jgi:uncharacterized tellurite resistance protein B-like protein